MKILLVITIIVLFVLFFSIGVTKTYAIGKQKLLIYGFRNIVQDSSDKTLDTKISVFLYDQISGNKKNKYKLCIVESKINLKRNNRIDENFLYEFAKENGFYLVLYGYYAKKGEKLKIFPKLLLVDRDIVVGVDRIYPKIYAAIRKVENLGISELIAYKSKKKLKIIYISSQTLMEPIKKVTVKKNKKPIFNSPIYFEISNHNGIIFPGNIWDMLYSHGVFSDIDLSLLSTKRTFPISLTFQTRYSFFNMSNNADYINSNLNMFYLGLGLDYNIYFKRYLEAIRFSVSGGFTSTLLSINNKDFETIDPTGNVSLNLIFRVGGPLKLRLGGGEFFVLYVNYPFTAFYVSAGIIFGK